MTEQTETNNVDIETEEFHISNRSPLPRNFSSDHSDQEILSSCSSENDKAPVFNPKNEVQPSQRLLHTSFADQQDLIK